MLLGLIPTTATAWQAMSFSDHVYLHVMSQGSGAVGKAQVLESGSLCLNLAATTY